MLHNDEENNCTCVSIEEIFFKRALKSGMFIASLKALGRKVGTPYLGYFFLGKEILTPDQCGIHPQIPDPLPHCNPRLNLWNDAESAQETPPVHYDPLVLDLNRDGKINLDNATFFDLNASGFHEYTRWISETDAFLVLDVNGNGKIDNGSEMFGDSMRLPDGSIALSGFDALRSYDSNGDGKIDANDEIFSSLKLLTGAGQLVTLGDAGVKSINIPDRTRLPEFNASALPRDERIRQDYQRWLNGGVNATHGSFEWDDGTEGAIDEVLPYRIPMYSIPDAKWDVPDEIAALPNLFGQGVLYDLQQIMAIDGSGELRGILEQYMSEKDPQKRETLMTQLLYKWAGVDEINPNSRGGLIDARQIAFLEAYFGQPFVGVGTTVIANLSSTNYTNSSGAAITLPGIQTGGNPNNTAAELLGNLFASIANEMDSALLVQTHIKPFFDEVEYEITAPVLDDAGNVVERGTINISFDSAIKWLGELAGKDPVEAAMQVFGLKKLFATSDAMLAEQLRTEGIYNDVLNLWEQLPSHEANAQWNLLKSELEQTLRAQNDTLSAIYNSNNLIFGRENQALSGTNANDVLLGTRINDKLYGGNGNDVLVGGTGNDYLEGGTGNNTYIYNKGDGHDVINNYSSYRLRNGENDILKFGAGISPEDISIERRGNDIVFVLENGSVTVQNWYLSQHGVDGGRDDYSRLKIIEFADGSSWDGNYIAANCVIYGTDGNDVLGAYYTNDRIYAGAGNDKLYGGTGNDVLAGGTGDDYLEGGTGNKTYIYNKGDGHDTINNYSSYGNSETDILKLGEGISPENISIERRGNDIVFVLDDGSVTVQNWYLAQGGFNGTRDDYSRLKTIEFADGNSWSANGGKSIEAYFAEQAELAIQRAAEASAMSEPENEMYAMTSLLSAGMGDEIVYSQYGLAQSTAELNSGIDMNSGDQLAIDIAIAELQMNSDIPMVCGDCGVNVSESHDCFIFASSESLTLEPRRNVA